MKTRSMTDMCAAWSERWLPQAMRTRPWRRAEVVFSYALAALTIVLAFQGAGPAVVPVGITASILFTMYGSAIQGLTDKLDRDIDERERALRDRAFRKALQALAWVGFPVAVYLGYVFPERNIVETLWALTAAWLMAWGLPGAVVAWTQPDVPAWDR